MPDGHRERTIMRRILLALCRITGVRLFRNNIGLAKYPDGSRVKYGLCPGSADLIGWRSMTVTPDMVGRKVAVFMAVETKAARGRVTAGQENFIDRVREAGGIAGVVRSEEEARGLIEASPHGHPWRGRAVLGRDHLDKINDAMDDAHNGKREYTARPPTR